MSIDYKDEYASLRQEILDRFNRIHDTLKYGVGGFIAFISFYFASDLFDILKPLDNILALLIMQSIIVLIGLSALNNYQRIYSAGTYIAVIIECDSGGKWHRMSRGYYDYLIKKNLIKGWDNCFYPIGQKWGSDSAVLSFVILSLTWVSFVIVWLKVKCLNVFIPVSPEQWVVFFIMLLPFCINHIIFSKLLRIEKYRKKLEKIWKEYSTDFGKEDVFPDPFKVT